MVNLVEMVNIHKNMSSIFIIHILARTLVDTSNSESPTTGRLPNGVRTVTKRKKKFFLIG